MPRSYNPRPDMPFVSQDARKLRNSISGFLPNIGLSMIDYGRSADIDRFYLLCQNHRDAYKDFSGKIHPIPEFCKSEKKYASRPDPTSIYVMQPINYMIEQRPVVYPLTTSRRGRPHNDGMAINLVGRYNDRSCVLYKP